MQTERLLEHLNQGRTIVGGSELHSQMCALAEDAIVAAGAVVTRDVPAMSVVGGVPAKVLKMIPSETEG